MTAPCPTCETCAHCAKHGCIPVVAVMLDGDAAQAHDQCRAVIHMALALAEIYRARAMILAAGKGPIDIIGEASASAMEWLGDALNNMDGIDEGDLWLDPIFDRAQQRWPAAPLRITSKSEALALADELDDASGRLTQRTNSPLDGLLSAAASTIRSLAAPSPIPVVEAGDAAELLTAARRIEKRIAYYASLAESEAPNIEQWAYTDDSSDVAVLRAALAKFPEAPK